MRIIEITEDKLSTLSENTEKMLRYGGKVMQCVDELQRESGARMGERYHMRDYRDGMDDHGVSREDWDGYGERRGGYVGGYRRY